MRLLALGALLYGLAAFGANALAGGLSTQDRAALDALRVGQMQNLVIDDEARPRIDQPFADESGQEVRLSDFAGKVVLVNLWATWCPPCRKEMPSLDRLAGEMAGSDLAVVALSSDRLGVAQIRKFFDQVGVKNLAVYHDKGGRVAHEAGAIGLPVTLILDRHGREIARLTGDADWDTPEARALLTRIIELTATPGVRKASAL